VTEDRYGCLVTQPARSFSRACSCSRRVRRPCEELVREPRKQDRSLLPGPPRARFQTTYMFSVYFPIVLVRSRVYRTIERLVICGGRVNYVRSAEQEGNQPRRNTRFSCPLPARARDASARRVPLPGSSTALRTSTRGDFAALRGFIKGDQNTRCRLKAWFKPGRWEVL